MKTKRERHVFDDKFTFVIFIITMLLLLSAILSCIIVQEDGIVSRQIFNALSCLFMLACLSLPMFFKRFFRVKIPRLMQIVFVAFCFCGIILGDVINFFDKFKHWDSLLHFSSGILLAVLGFILINTLNGSDSQSMHLSPVFVAASVFCFALAAGAVWEIVEYTIDELFGTNMQTFMVDTTGSFSDGGLPLAGHEALADTMNDLMLDALGALIISAIGFADLKKKKKGLTTTAFEQEKKEPVSAPAKND